jgi:hypothetical protein
MVGLLGHRQTKGTVTDNDEPNATAPHPDSTDRVDFESGRSGAVVGTETAAKLPFPQIS